MRADRRTDTTKLMVTFRNFANSPSRTPSGGTKLMAAHKTSYANYV